MENQKEELVKAQYGRVKGASWFPLLYKKDILVLGQGGIGSWVSLFLSRIGCTLHVFDDDRYEEHNLTGQFATKHGVNKPKVEEIKRLIGDFSPDCTITAYNERYGSKSLTGDIVICGFDNMVARKIAFQKWKEGVGPSDLDDGRNCFFQDGRLLAEQLQIFNIPGNRKDLIERYEREHLFSDAEGAEGDCTFKQTSHCAAMIASHMVGFLTTWAGPIKKFPFLYEYVIPLNYTKNDQPTV